MRSEEWIVLNSVCIWLNSLLRSVASEVFVAMHIRPLRRTQVRSRHSGLLRRRRHSVGVRPNLVCSWAMWICRR